jgi:hypothetical protein
VGIPRSIQRDGSLTDGSLYESARRCWRTSLGRASRAKYLLGVIDGVVKIVVEISGCDYVKNGYCDTLCKYEKLCKKGVNRERLVFEGEEIKGDTKYLKKIIPEDYRPGQNPVRYTYT